MNKTDKYKTKWLNTGGMQVQVQHTGKGISSPYQC